MAAKTGGFNDGRIMQARAPAAVLRNRARTTTSQEIVTARMLSGICEVLLIVRARPR